MLLTCTYFPSQLYPRETTQRDSTLVETLHRLAALISRYAVCKRRDKVDGFDPVCRSQSLTTRRVYGCLLHATSRLGLGGLLTLTFTRTRHRGRDFPYCRYGVNSTMRPRCSQDVLHLAQTTTFLRQYHTSASVNASSAAER